MPLPLLLLAFVPLGLPHLLDGQQQQQLPVGLALDVLLSQLLLLLHYGKPLLFLLPLMQLMSLLPLQLLAA